MLHCKALKIKPEKSCCMESIPGGPCNGVASISQGETGPSYFEWSSVSGFRNIFVILRSGLYKQVQKQDHRTLNPRRTVVKPVWPPDGKAFHRIFALA